MLVTGDGVAVEGRYPRWPAWTCDSREVLDRALADAASAGRCGVPPAGCGTDAAVARRWRSPGGPGATCATGDGSRVRYRRTCHDCGRRSSVNAGLRAGPRAPSHPRHGAGRWRVHAIAAYRACPRWARCTSAPGTTSASRRCPDGWPTSASFGRRQAVDRLAGSAWRADAAVAAEPMLRDRFAGARFVGRPLVLGRSRWTRSTTPSRLAGLLLAGDAAGFVDPMTGDGLRFALRGGELAAHAALRALEHGWDGVHRSLAETRQVEFGGEVAIQPHTARARRLVARRSRRDPRRTRRARGRARADSARE